MVLTAQNLVAWHDVDGATHTQKESVYAKQGFRSLSLSIYGSISSPRYASVMVKRPAVIAVKSFIGRTQAQFQQVFEEMAEQKFGPFIITATGPKNGAIFAGCFRNVSQIPLTRLNLSKQEFQDLCLERKDKGQILVWADCFGTPDDPRYCAVFGPNPERIAWNIDALDEGGTPLQQRFLAMRSVGARPALVSVTPSGRLMEMFVDSQIGSWDSRIGLTSAQYQERFDLNAKQGLWPVCVSASGSGSGTRFAALFAKQEEHASRKFRAKGSSPIAAIDAQLQQHMAAHNLRGAALAIVQGTRLVYARGYTYAEDGYADLLPTTAFRLASVSKTFCAVAIWRLIQQKQLTLATTLQSVLGLTQPNGQPPKSSDFGKITIQHLLESRSGLPQGGLFDSVQASQAAGGTLPSTGLEVARWVASKDLTAAPGTKCVYGNTDYMMLSLVAAKLTNSSSFEGALQKLVLDPLGMKRTRGARSLAAEQLVDEARHHLTVHAPTNGWALYQLECGASDRTQDRPLVPAHYGSIDYEVFDGSGGLSASVVDVARLCAMFSQRVSNPVLSAATIDQMLANAVQATDTLTDHGYHGFDWASNVSLANHRVAFAKGGWLPGLGTTFTGTTNGVFYVYLQNGNSIKGAGSWLDRIESIVTAQSWDSVDLFPDFGMPSFATVPFKVSVPLDPVVSATTATIDPRIAAVRSVDGIAKQVEDSMTRLAPIRLIRPLTLTRP